MQERRLNFRLLSFCDMAEVIRHYAPVFDWTSLVWRAHQWGVAPYVYLSLQLARDLVGAAVPESALAAMEPKGFDTRLLGWARDELLEDAGASPLFPDLLQLWRGRGFGDRLGVIKRILAPAVIAKSYGIAPVSKKRYGYYPVRLKDLLKCYGPVLWRLAWHDPALIAQADRKAHLSAWLSPFKNRPRDECQRH